MSNLKDIRHRISGVRKIEQITRALKMVAAVRLRRAQQMLVDARPYALRMRDLMGHIASLVDRSLHPLLDVHDEVNKVGFLVITSDQGLCGNFNHNIIRRTEELLGQYNKDQINLLLVGRKSEAYFFHRDYKIIGEYVALFRQLKYSHAVNISNLLKNSYIQNKLDRIYVVYNEFKSATRQDVVAEQLLPIVPLPPGDEHAMPDFIFEPNDIDILDNLCPLNINIQLWRILLESQAAEMGARMTSMEYATDNADHLIAELTHSYNKLRQEGITNEILEIVSGSEALKYE
ncbi:ATP synthase F1 subunit gamma [candidate division KSB1 bacterium]|nr:ATP synthase F1 subunit gamma [candidate division KSB1 bacterium]